MDLYIKWAKINSSVIVDCRQSSPVFADDLESLAIATTKNQQP